MNDPWDYTPGERRCAAIGAALFLIGIALTFGAVLAVITSAALGAGEAAFTAIAVWVLIPGAAALLIGCPLDVIPTSRRLRRCMETMRR